MTDSTRLPGQGESRQGGVRPAFASPPEGPSATSRSAEGGEFAALHKEARDLAAIVDWYAVDAALQGGGSLRVVQMHECPARGRCGGAGDGATERGVGAVDGVAVARRLLETARDDADRLPVFMDVEPLLGGLAVFPLLCRGELVGALTVGTCATLGLSHPQLLGIEPIAVRLAESFGAMRRGDPPAATTVGPEDVERFTQALQGIATPLEVAEAAVDEGRRAVGGRAAILWLLDPLWRTLELTAASGIPTELMREWSSLRVQTPVVNPVTEAIAMGRPLWIASRTEMAQRYPELVAKTPELGKREAFGFIPLIVGGRTLGMLSVAYAPSATPDAGGRAALERVAEATAAALERSRVTMERHLDAKARVDGAFGVSGDVLGALGTLVIVLDAEARLVRWNPACERLTGFSFEDARDHGYRRMVSAQNLASLDETLGRVRQSGQPRGCELAWTTRGGERRWIAWSFSPVSRDEGQATHFVGTGIDISDTRRAKAERARAVRDEAERLAREDLLAMASHDLKEPLAALRLQQDMVMRTLRKSPERVSGEWLEAAMTRSRETVDRAVRLIDDLLATGRSTGPVEVFPEDLDLAEVARDVLARQAELLDAGACEASCVCEGQVRGRWDRVRIEQILTNLLTNAVKYGTGRPILIEIGADAKTAWIEVSDGGPGIAPEHRELVFERFYRATDEAASESHGLGLWIVRRIVEALGGRIAVGEAVSGGARFRVDLPR